MVNGPIFIVPNSNANEGLRCQDSSSPLINCLRMMESELFITSAHKLIGAKAAAKAPLLEGQLASDGHS